MSDAAATIADTLPAAGEFSIAHCQPGGMNHIGHEHWPDGRVPWRPATPPDIEAGRTTGRLRSCAYCGSMHPADLAAAIKAGARLDPADRKYGWPHKYYADGVPNPHAGMLESRMSSSHAIPVCPDTGKPCIHGKQSFHWQPCACMRDRPGEVKHGATADGRPVVAVQDGFSRTTGRPEFRWIAAGEPAAPTTYGKFYTVHLQDATPEDREVIERAMRLTFNFLPDGRISWAPYGA